MVGLYKRMDVLFLGFRGMSLEKTTELESDDDDVGTMWKGELDESRVSEPSGFGEILRNLYGSIMDFISSAIVFSLVVL